MFSLFFVTLHFFLSESITLERFIAFLFKVVYIKGFVASEVALKTKEQIIKKKIFLVFTL